jgi:hypothetical protein
LLPGAGQVFSDTILLFPSPQVIVQVDGFLLRVTVALQPVNVFVNELGYIPHRLAVITPEVEGNQDRQS